jgi:transposase
MHVSKSGDGIETHGFGVKDLRKLLADARKSLGPAGMDRFQERIAFVRSRLSGRSVAESSISAGISVRSGYNIQAVWNKYGPKGLYPNFSGGRKPKMSAQQLVQFHDEYHRRRMSANESREYIREEFGIEYSQKQIYIIISKVSSMTPGEVGSDDERRREEENKKAADGPATVMPAHTPSASFEPAPSSAVEHAAPRAARPAVSSAKPDAAPHAEAARAATAVDAPKVPDSTRPKAVATPGRPAQKTVPASVDRPAAKAGASSPPAVPEKRYDGDIDAGRALLGKRQVRAAPAVTRPENAPERHVEEKQAGAPPLPDAPEQKPEALPEAKDKAPAPAATVVEGLVEEVASASSEKKPRDMAAMMKGWSRDAVKKTAARTGPTRINDEVADVMKLTVPDLSEADILTSEDSETHLVADDGMESYDRVFRSKPLRREDDMNRKITQGRLRFSKKP